MSDNLNNTLQVLTDHPLIEELMPPGYCIFMTDLVRTFRPVLKVLLEERQNRKNAEQSEPPHFLKETKSIREGDWKVAPIPGDLLDRRVEITGPPDRKMTINALNSGAKVFMADFEDSLCPTWENVLQGQVNLRDAVRGGITYEHPTKGTYKLNSNPATLFVRPRGLHLTEAHVTVDGEPVPASLFDWGTYMWHNAKELKWSKRSPYFYLPKLEHWHEARWWNSVFEWGEQRLGLETGDARATVLIETLTAAFQMNEILWALRDHSVGLNCGRWDYIFSYIKRFSRDPQRVTPDRASVNMSTTFMDTYSRLLIDTCHKRGCHAMGGMAAQIPIRNDEEANTTAMNKVRADKLREVQNGHDGTWVAHPGLVSLAQDVFDEHMLGDNQVGLVSELHAKSEEDLAELLTSPPEVNEGSITPQGVLQNIDVGVRYLAAWLSGQGCVPLYNLMEDAATAEISRSQLWQWARHDVKASNGRNVDEVWINEELTKIVEGCTDETEAALLSEAANMFGELCKAEELPEFLTLPAYDRIIEND